MTLRRHLERLRKVKRKHHHPLLHHIHKKHSISRRTLFYVKEYGPHSNVPRTIIRESIRILLFASIISSLGGLALEQIRTLLFSIIPLLVLLPALNDMIGSCGTIASSRLSTMLHEGKLKRGVWSNTEIRRLFAQIFIVTMTAAVFSSCIAIAVSWLWGYGLGTTAAVGVFLIAVIDVAVLAGVVFFVSVMAGLHFFRKGEDPNNFLIPITTSVADLGNMLLLSALVAVMF